MDLINKDPTGRKSRKILMHTINPYGKVSIWGIGASMIPLTSLDIFSIPLQKK